MTKTTLPSLILTTAALATLAACGDKADASTTAPPAAQATPAAAPAAAPGKSLPKVTDQSGTLNIDTDPGGAQIFINGQRKGNSSTRQGQSFGIKLGEGSYTIEAHKADGDEYEYLGRETDVLVTDNTVQSVTIKLERRQTEQGKRLEQERMARQEAERKKAMERQGYTASADGKTITDKKTRLMWMRCSLGQNWNGRACAGSASKYTWEEARQIARGTSYAGHSDWRLPTIDELKTLVYCSSGKRAGFRGEGLGGECEGDYSRPTIFEPAFPDTPSAWVWSGSPYAGGSSYAWYVLFYNGYAGSYHRSSDGHVRLVRAGQ